MKTSNEKRGEAAGELLKFVADYTQLLQSQISEIKKEMAHVVNNVMDSVKKLNQEQSAKTKMAESILVMDRNKSPMKQVDTHDNFKEYSAKLKTEVETKALSDANINVQEMYASNIKKVGYELREHMKSLKNLDSTIQDSLLTMVGALSADDVVGQRLDHVNDALGILANGLGELIQHMDQNFTPEGVDKFSLDINTAIYGKYTIPHERDCFIKVHGFKPYDPKLDFKKNTK